VLFVGCLKTVIVLHLLLRRSVNMHKEYLMGNEAMACAAIAAGVNVVSGYPGTPSTEVLDNISKRNKGNIYVEWSINEKSGMEVAAGAAYSGARSLVTMKQVGLNVAADPLMSLEYIGVKGAMVVLVADDPGPISSQTEQDTRTFAMFSKLPIFDPSTVQEAYDMMLEAFRVSEEYHTPVFIRPTTRIDHGYEAVSIRDEDEYIHRDIEGFVKDSSKWVIFPRLSVKNHALIEKRNAELSEVFSEYEGNCIYQESGSYEIGSIFSGRNVGIASHGINHAYIWDNIDKANHPRLLKVSTPFPFPEKKAVEFLEGLDEVLVIEELDPVIERALVYVCGKYGLHVRIHGKIDGYVKPSGENTMDEVRELLQGFVSGELNERRRRDRKAAEAVMAAGTEKTSAAKAGAEGTEAAGTTAAANAIAAKTEPAVPPLPVRPPVLCAGCPHRASFYAVKQAMKDQKTIFCGDIGCYTLGNAQPLDMCDTCLCMGAGINIAQGVWHTEPDTKAFAFVGDSTFFAAGITGSINGLFNQADMTLVVLDNSTTAMTGHQPHPGTGETMMGDVVEKVDIEALLRAAGVKTVETVNPMELDAAVKAVKRVADEPGFKAIIFKYPCIVKFKPKTAKAHVDRDKCVSCRKCINELGCPGVIWKDGKAAIDESQCTGCTLCEQVCPVGAISGGEARNLGDVVKAAQDRQRAAAMEQQGEYREKAERVAAAMRAGAESGTQQSEASGMTSASNSEAASQTAVSESQVCAGNVSIGESAGVIGDRCINIIMAGVGGQGTVLASKLVSAAAMSKGLIVRGAETIGMAQRGGSVVSYIRVGGDTRSPLIGSGMADIIIGFEPGETVRMLKYLAPGGRVISSVNPVYPVSALTGAAHYNPEEVIEYLRKVVPADALTIIDTEEAMSKLGNSKVMNTLMLGAALDVMDIGIDREAVREAMHSRLPEKLWELNDRALDYYTAEV